ncbi:unnamed protein product, partial [Urochloa humidicola]
MSYTNYVKTHVVSGDGNLLSEIIRGLEGILKDLQEGSEAGVGAVGTGCHVDAIPFSGKYDCCWCYAKK